MVHVALRVNGRAVEATVDDRTTLADFLRDSCAITGVKLGCELGSCGACTVLLDGESVRSCIMLAAQADGAEISTTEYLATMDPVGQELAQAFLAHDTVQCGFCTPGMFATCTELLVDGSVGDTAEIRRELSGNLCRCTGYTGIVDAVRDAAERLREHSHGGSTTER